MKKIVGLELLISLYNIIMLIISIILYSLFYIKRSIRLNSSKIFYFLVLSNFRYYFVRGLAAIELIFFNMIFSYVAVMWYCVNLLLESLFRLNYTIVDLILYIKNLYTIQNIQIRNYKYYRGKSLKLDTERKEYMSSNEVKCDIKTLKMKNMYMLEAIFKEGKKRHPLIFETRRRYMAALKKYLKARERYLKAWEKYQERMRERI